MAELAAAVGTYFATASTAATVASVASAAATAYGAYSTLEASKNSKAAAGMKGEAALPGMEKPTAMPNADASAMAAKRNSIADLLRRRGRASTILTDAGQDRLGAA